MVWKRPILPYQCEISHGGFFFPQMPSDQLLLDLKVNPLNKAASPSVMILPVGGRGAGQLAAIHRCQAAADWSPPLLSHLHERAARADGAEEAAARSGADGARVGGAQS